MKPYRRMIEDQVLRTLGWIRDIELTLRRASILATNRLSLRKTTLRGLMRQFDHLFEEIRRTSSAGRGLRMARSAKNGVSQRTSVSPAVKVDPMALDIVFAVLINNAIRYATHDGKGVLAVSVEERKTDVLCVVADDGPGIDPDLRARIFEAGTRGRPTTLSSFSGRGMGLHDARLIMQEMGGELLLMELRGRSRVRVPPSQG